MPEIKDIRKYGGDEVEIYQSMMAQLEREVQLGVSRQGIVIMALERIAASTQVIGGSQKGDICFYEALKDTWENFDFTKYNKILSELLANPHDAINVYHSYFPFDVRRIIRKSVKKSMKANKSCAQGDKHAG